MPQFKNLDLPGSAEGSYYTWVDQFNTFGLGENTPINTGNQSGALLVLNDGEWVRLRVPYPLGFYTKWLDGPHRRSGRRLQRPRAMGDL